MIHTEYKYTKTDIFEYFKASEETRSNGQYIATVLYIRKTNRIIEFLEMLYNIASMNNYHLIDDSQSMIPNHPQFIDCRHDQSIFSVAMKQLYKNKVVIPEETWPPSGDWKEVEYVPVLGTRIRSC